MQNPYTESKGDKGADHGYTPAEAEITSLGHFRGPSILQSFTGQTYVSSACPVTHDYFILCLSTERYLGEKNLLLLLSEFETPWEVSIRNLYLIISQRVKLRKTTALVKAAMFGFG